MSEYVKAWQCIGCGKIEMPQTCIGVCQDRKVEFVYAFEHESVLTQLSLARRQANALGTLARQLAWTQPRDGKWENSYRALQKRARRILAETGSNAPGIEDPGPHES